MEALEPNSIRNIHILPRYLSDRILVEPASTGFDDLDKRMVILSKRGFIVADAMATGTDQEVITKMQLFKSALVEYLQASERRIYAPFENGDVALSSGKQEQLVEEFQPLKSRLLHFLEFISIAALSHRALCSKAICRIDKMIVQRCSAEREILYPVLNKLQG